MKKKYFDLFNPFWGKMFLNRLINFYYHYKKNIYKIYLPVVRWRINQRNLLNHVWKLSNSSKPIKIEINEQVISHSDSLCKGQMDVFSIGTIELGNIDWHRDYKSGFRWEPGSFYKSYKIVDTSNSADVKIPWEISRAHHFLYLGQAFLITGDEKYANKFVEQVIDWIEQNPCMRSINWTCTMEVAIRAVNWIYALKMFDKSKALRADIRYKIYLSLYQHGYFIFRNPEKSEFNNHNHYLSDLAGQIQLGLMFKGDKEADLWLKEGLFEFFREIRTQILPSGPTYERSVSYHRLVTELIAYTVIELESNGFEIPSDIKYRIEKMFEFILNYIRPDGSVPIIGDQDDGRFLPFSHYQNTDHRYLLTIGAIIFNRSDFKKFSNGINNDAIILFGTEAIESFNKIPETDIHLGSVAFKDAGFFIIRRETNYMFINLSGKGRYPEIQAGTHTHSDLLSFDLTVNGVPFFEDSGTFLYSANPEQRMLFRSTAMHNTVLIDDKDQNELRSDVLWDFKTRAIPKLLLWEDNDDYSIFEGEHDGYKRLNSPLVHRRKILFDKLHVIWEITDSFIGEGDHDIKINFNLNENVIVEQLSNEILLVNLGVTIRLSTSSTDYDLIILDSHISKRYGTKIPNKRICFHTSSGRNPIFRTFIHFLSK